MRKNKLATILVTCISLQSCDVFNGQSQNPIEKTTATAKSLGNQLVSTVSSKVSSSMKCEVILGKNLQKAGLHSGKVTFSSTKEATDNILNVYLIFDKKFEGKLLIKAYDDNGLEYGRISSPVSGNQNKAGYYEFVFDKKVNLEYNSKFIVDKAYD